MDTSTSPHPRAPWIACAAALPGELGGLRRRMTVQAFSDESGVGCYVGRYRDVRLLLVRTGMGRRAERATRIILDRYPVTAFINFGFAGAMADRLQAGDLVLCQRLYQQDDPQGLRVISSDAGLMQKALTAARAHERERVHARARRIGCVTPVLGNGVTVDRPVSQPGQKRALSEVFPADVLEMESYYVGRTCAERRVPFLAVRAVSDAAGQNLPPLERFVSPEGRVRWLAALSHFLVHPTAVAQTARFAGTACLARQRLTRFMCALLDSWGAA